MVGLLLTLPLILMCSIFSHLTYYYCWLFCFLHFFFNSVERSTLLSWWTPVPGKEIGWVQKVISLLEEDDGDWNATGLYEKYRLEEGFLLDKNWAGTVGQESMGKKRRNMGRVTLSFSLLLDQQIFCFFPLRFQVGRSTILTPGLFHIYARFFSLADFLNNT